MSDSTINLEQLDAAQAAKEVTANQLFDAASPATIFGRHAEACAGLTFAYYGGRFGGVAVANGANLCGASTTTYMVVNRSTSAVSFSTANTNWNDATNYARAYKITTDIAAVTGYEDHRAGAGGTQAGGGGGGSGSSPTTTKGDLIVRSATVDSRLAVGADGQTLVADSTQALGVKWAHVFGWFNAKGYGAKGDGKRVGDGVANSTTTVTSATAAFVAGDVGKVLEINNGTTTFASTISAYVSATNVTLAAAVPFTASTCEIYFGTDDTTSIQAAITAAATAGGGTVYASEGIFMLAGALQDTGRSNAQLQLPSRDISGSGTVIEPITIAIVGAMAAPGLPYVITVSSLPVPVRGTIFKSTLNTPSGTAPCCIGGWGPSTSFGNFTNVNAVLRNLTVRLPRNPALSAVDFSHCVTCAVDEVNVDAGAYDIMNVVTQTTAASYAFKSPTNGNGGSTQIGRLTLLGFYNGTTIAEHYQARALTVWGSQNALVFVAADHSSYIARAGLYHCKNGLVFTGGIHATFIDALNFEHASSGTWTPTYDISDPSTYARGSVRWHTVLANTGAVNTLLVNGAAALKRTHPQPCVFGITDAATVTPDLSASDDFRWTLAGNRTLANALNPYDSQVFNVQLIQDATGSRTLTLGSKYKFPGGAPTLSTAANAVDLISCQYDLTSDTFRCAISKALS